ncbi:MAG: type III polyketide synthase [Hyphomicrobiales bacterium]|nr:type III polyketide synthase [Hyphomicrobiales bacterium]
MLTELEAQQFARSRSRIVVDIAGLATAVPKYKLGQEDAVERASRIFPQYARRTGLFANTGVETRYTVEPTEWYLEPRSWEERTESFQRNALDLLEDVAARAIAAAGLEPGDIDAIVTNTITGLAIPSLDARLMNRMPFRSDVERLPIFGLGCGGGVAGLARAARMARACAKHTVLFMTVDLCSLCLRTADPSLAMFVSSALFSDGAAAVVLRSGQEHEITPGMASQGRVVTSGEHFWGNTEHIMGWDIRNDGFGVVLSPDLPELMQGNLGQALEGFLDREGLTIDDFDGFLFHPGGAKVLQTVQTILNLDRGGLAHSWDVLRDYGNMSSATAMFVLQSAIKSGARGRHLLAAFGPGFSAYFVILDL